LTTHYESKKGKLVIADMNFSHLANATTKSERERPGHPETLALRAELDKRMEDDSARL
jgi:hypothetical protein